MRVVIDTSVFISAVIGYAGGASRQVLRHCLLGEFKPVMGTALFLEYEAVAGRDSIVNQSRLTGDEIGELLDAFVSVCSWTTIYYRWRPNLVDEADHHIVELAVAAGVSAIVTKNLRHLKRGELSFPHIRVVAPNELLKEL